MNIISLIICLLLVLVKDSYSENSVRLFNGKTPHEGIVQIRYNHTWATVLDYDGMRPPEPLLHAFVVCRMLNYTKAIKGYSVWYNPHNANITYWPKELDCTGRENTIQECRNRTRLNLDGSIDPPPYWAFYAICGRLSEVDKKLQVRLVETDQRNYGIVEIRNSSNNSNWSKICIENVGQWQTKDANVVCKMLGYKHAIKGFLFKTPKSGGNSGIPRRYHCTGKEATLAECAQARRPSCKPGSDYYVGAFCEKNTKPPPLNYRLFYKHSPNTGYLLVQVRGVWGTACYSNLDGITHDNRACQEMGYLGSYEFASDYPEDDRRPETVVTWKLNRSCIKIPTGGNCSHEDMWIIRRYSPCEYPSKVSCKVANVPDYSLVSGCPPTLNINRTGLTEKEKKLITYYQVETNVFNGSLKIWSMFYIPGKTTTLVLGDGKKYVKGLNQPLETGKQFYVRKLVKGLNSPLEIGKKYYVRVTAVYEDKNGTFVYGDKPNLFPWYEAPSVEKYCPTSPAPTSIMTDVSSTSYSEHATEASGLIGEKLDAGHIVAIVVGVLVVIAILGMVIFVYKKRNDEGHHEHEHVKLYSVPGNQKA